MGTLLMASRISLSSYKLSPLKCLHSDRLILGQRTSPSRSGCQFQRIAAASENGGISTNLSDDLVRLYFQMQCPALANKLYSDAIKDFTQQAILAYECGCNEADLCEQLQQSALTDKCGLSHQRPAQAIDMGQCLIAITLVWLTLMISPCNGSAKRWATGTAVSDLTVQRWKGFVSLIVDGYFDHRMAWYPLDRLGLEVVASCGESETPDKIAEKARLVFTTLEQVHPQFPSMY
ncbi:hypothetical protein CEUSTIGMA_g5757.t1 [Chlamydomonas eustigma]|uniref:DUF7876 domain-containing protein n=1 Tax=Chlamydomonas eustigma TaxID=1157962 RepID=A0A250X5F5_9CHLO|nr:hypothetical protein CEUSTIGMA_g5757.t1 [Chlamydomonas eustigma]|eukprot:GAX78315.1 hypothetical protein CEUSTIGMA_g5757.t1 [Chlamydomonas eustigma]